MMIRLLPILTLLLALSQTLSFSPTATFSTCNQYQRQTEHERFFTLRQSSTSDDDETKPAMPFKHALAILTMPYTSVDRIANEAILERVLTTTNKLSVVLRCQGPTPSLACLRRYVGEVYSQLWDCAVGTQDPVLPDVVVYPQNLPNVAPESWITIQRDLDAVCSTDSITGWVTDGAQGRGRRFQSAPGDGVGGLHEHVAALNSERANRDLPPVTTLTLLEDADQRQAQMEHDSFVVFLDDDDDGIAKGRMYDADEPQNELFLGGARIPPNQIFDSVAVGGTFDGLHFGHRKLLTLAMSSVNPVTGRLMVGVTVDEMLLKKENAEYIPDLKERMDGVRAFLSRLAPGMMNRVKLVPISDTFGPPGQPDQHFDALVLSHETLDTGYKLNRHRQENLGMEPLHLLCTRRTEAHGMSSTALRRMRRLKEKDDSTTVESSKERAI